MSKFSAGDEVQYVGAYGHYGETGTVVAVIEDEPIIVRSYVDFRLHEVPAEDLVKLGFKVGDRVEYVGPRPTWQGEQGEVMMTVNAMGNVVVRAQRDGVDRAVRATHLKLVRPKRRFLRR